jgi:hypothetical protein
MDGEMCEVTQYWKWLAMKVAWQPEKHDTTDLDKLGFKLPVS